MYYHQLVGINLTEAYLNHMVGLEEVEITGGKLHFKIKSCSRRRVSLKRETFVFPLWLSHAFLTSLSVHLFSFLGDLLSF